MDAAPPSREPAGVACWVCGGTRGERWGSSLGRPLRARDLEITDASYGDTLRLRRCAECGFLFSDDPEVSRLGELYAELDDDAYVEGSEPRRRQMHWLLDEACRGRAVRDLLDVGCASGLLLREAEARGIRATGVEPSRSLARHARDAGLDVLVGTLPHPQLEGRTFDLVTLVDVLEHVDDPVGLLANAARHMRPDGTMLVVTPDIGSVVARVLGRRWWHLRPAHVGYFDDETARLAARRAGLRVERSFGARWYFHLGYLLERVRRYLPIDLPAAAAGHGAARRLRSLVVPLQLGDSMCLLLRRQP